ncbi:MAG: bifunctional DNA primase/polymerase [Rhodobiaceae bacterium]|nr:bifunctional DNA primase/polymerase [Rhodobiaceae bacterium]MCC0051825.1 bifunctional DNA primase/polymerase [Rhodobiaceae bacterium]
MADTISNLQAALDLARRGYHVFPCYPGGEKAKRPMTPPVMSWANQSSCDPAQVQRWWATYPHAAIGLDVGKSGLVVIDADRHGEHDGVEAMGVLMGKHDFNPDSAPLVATPNEGNHHFFRVPEGTKLGNGRGALPAGIDVRGAGGYVIAPGTVMADGRVYEIYGNLDDAPMLPDWLMHVISAPREEAKRDIPLRAQSQSGNHDGDRTLDEIADLLACIHADCGYEEWYQVLMAIHAETGGSAAGLALADQWSSGGSKYKGRREIEVKWRSFKRDGITGATLADIARAHGGDLSAIAKKHNKPADQLGTAEHGWQVYRQIIQARDGTLADAETGEVIETTSATTRGASANQPDYPDGLVGDLARWIVATSRKPQPAISIGAALTLVGLACGRHIAGPTMTGTTLYVLGLAPTGKGKDAPLKQISRVLTQSRMAAHIGPPEFISMSSVVNMLKRKPCALCPMDEFGDFMARVYSRKGGPHERAIPKILRTMWSANFDQAATPEWAQVESVQINAPHLSIFAVSTHEQFYSAIEGGATSDGTLNRFLLIDGLRNPVEREPELDPHSVPMGIINDMALVFRRSGEMATYQRNDIAANPADAGHLTVLPWCPDGAEKEWKRFQVECERTMLEKPDEADFWVRGAEMAIRIATIIAAGRHGANVNTADVAYGVDFVRRSIHAMVAGARDYMAENENEAAINRIIRILKERGVVKKRDLMRTLKGIRAKDLRDVLAFMDEAGMIEVMQVKAERGPPAVSYRLL